MSGLILSDIHYNLFNEPWLDKKGIETDIVWDTYVEILQDGDREYIPMWEDYFEESDNLFNQFYDEVISYIAFGDFYRYQYPQSPEECDFFYQKHDEHAHEIDADFMNLFDEMRLAIIDTAGTFHHIPVARVW